MLSSIDSSLPIILPIAQKDVETISIKDVFILASFSLQMQVNFLPRNPEKTHGDAISFDLFKLQGQYVHLYRTYTLSKTKASFLKLQKKHPNAFYGSLTFGEEINLFHPYKDGSAERTLLYQMEAMDQRYASTAPHLLNSSFTDTNDLDVLAKDRACVTALWHKYAEEWKLKRAQHLLL